MRIGPASFLALVLVASCGDDGDGAGGDALEPSDEALAFLTELCSLYEPCCATGGSSKDECLATTRQRARNRTYDAERAKACLDAVRAASSTDTFCLQAPATVTCAAVFTHPRALAPGEGCSRATDCTSGPEGDGFCVAETCRRVTIGQEGDACVGTRVAGTTDPIVKLPEVLAGAPVALCDAAQGLYCAEETGKCTRRSGVGGPCDGSDLSCTDDAWCPRTSSQCAERTAGGERCEDAYECALGHACANDGAGNAECVAFVGEGGACERGDECDTSLVCGSSSTCEKDSERSAAACKGDLVFADPF